MSKEYLQPCPLSWVHEQLKAKANRDERFTVMDAAQSLLLDQLREIERSKSAYARLWGWPRSTLYEKWDEVTKQMNRQRTFYRSDEEDEVDDEKCPIRQTLDTPLDTSRHPVGQKSPDNVDKEGNPDTPSDNSRHPSDTFSTPYITDSLDNTDKEKEVVAEDTRAREGLGFLQEEDRQSYGRTIAALVKRYSPTSVDEMVRNQWGRRSGAIPLNDFAELARGHPWPRVVAATVITADAAQNPNMRYLRKVLNGFDEERHANRNGHEEAEDEYAELFD